MAKSTGLSAILKSKHQKVKVAVTDLDGVLRGKYIHKDKFASASRGGFGFCNVVFGWDINDACYDNSKYTGWHTGYPDAQAVFDPKTLRKVPWDQDVPFLLADFVEKDGTPLAVCPRQLLKSVIGQAREMGFQTVFGCEFEFFNFQETPQSLAEKKYVSPKPLTPGMFGYSLLRSGWSQSYFSALMDELPKFGVPLEGLHTETGPGVYEAAILRANALEAADRAILFKTATKEIGYRHGVLPSFMAKWDAKLPGTSGHIHQSLLGKNGKNVFYDAKEPNGMSKTFQSYLAGQMELLPEILPMYAPNINSYKRLVEGLWAPTTVTWGLDNRTTALRVIPGSEKSTRLETRIAGADFNPYLGIAAALASGLWGIRHKKKLRDKPTQGNAYENKKAKELPRNLKDATEAMKRSRAAKELFGKTFHEHFVLSREWEWREFQKSVTNWEMERYFEIV